MRVWLNGRIVPEGRALVSVFDRGFLYGDGVYETLRAYRGVPFHLEEHYRRLVESARRIDLPLPFSRAGFRRALLATLRANRLKEAVLRLTISRGAGPVRLDPAGFRHPTTAIMPRPAVLDERTHSRGARAVIVSIRRNPSRALDPRIKSLNFLNNILALREARAYGADEAILLNLDGELTEATTANLFFVRHGVVSTPALSCGLLSGVTRDQVIRLARRAGLKVRAGRYRPAALCGADEAFFTNTTQEITPLTRVNGRPIGSGRPGPITRRLHQLLRAAIADYTARP